MKLLKTIPGIGEFFARLIDAEIDDISRFRNPKKLPPMPGLCPTYSSGGQDLPRQESSSKQQVAALALCRAQSHAVVTTRSFKPSSSI